MACGIRAAACYAAAFFMGGRTVPGHAVYGSPALLGRGIARLGLPGAARARMELLPLWGLILFAAPTACVPRLWHSEKAV